MEKQQAGKRSIALPISFVLLLFSLIGNVLLYSLYLQHQQDENFEAGQSIYAAAAESRQYFEELLIQLEILTQSKGLDDRIEAKYLAGKALQKGQAVVDLAMLAEQIADPSGTTANEQTTAFITEVDQAIRTIGNGAGPLNETNKAYLLRLIESIEEMAAVMSGFNTNIADNRSAIIRLSSGLDWTERVAQLQRLMEEFTASLPART